MYNKGCWSLSVFQWCRRSRTGLTSLFLFGGAAPLLPLFRGLGASLAPGDVRCSPTGAGADRAVRGERAARGLAATVALTIAVHRRWAAGTHVAQCVAAVALQAPRFEELCAKDAPPDPQLVDGLYFFDACYGASDQDFPHASQALFYFTDFNSVGGAFSDPGDFSANLFSVY